MNINLLFFTELIWTVVPFLFYVLILLVLREVVMWYWKINTIVENQENQIRLQQETNDLLIEQINLMKDHYKAEKGGGSTGSIDLNKM